MDFAIGPRMLKTGIAVAVTLLVTSFFNLQLGFVAAISSVLAMQPSIMRSFEYVKAILISNSIGIIFALTGVYLAGSNPVWIGILVVIVISINIKLGLNKTTNLTILTMLMLMVNVTDDTVEVGFVLNRLSLIGIGVASSFFVNVVVFPPDHKKNIFKELKKASEKSLFLIRVIPNKTMKISEMKDHVKDLGKQISKAKGYFEVIDDEKKRMCIKDKRSFLRNIIIFDRMVAVTERNLRLIKSLNKSLDKIEAMSSDKGYIIKKLLNELSTYNENLIMMYEGKILLDKNLQRESRNAMRLTLNNLIEELQGSSIDKWSFILPVANNIMGLFLELERLESAVRSDVNKRKKKEKSFLGKLLKKIIN